MLPIADAILDEMFPAKDIISSRRDSRTVVVDGVTDVNESMSLSLCPIYIYIYYTSIGDKKMTRLPSN